MNGWSFDTKTVKFNGFDNLVQGYVKLFFYIG